MANKEKITLMTPLGRLINSSLFEKDSYKDEHVREGTPNYKLEMAFDFTDEFKAFEQQIVAAVVAEWGAGAEEEYWDGGVKTAVLDGNVLAKERAERGKPGDVYADKVVVRAHTIFNRNGEDAAGGVYVCDENAKELDFAGRGKIYNGCHGHASTSVRTYKIDGKRGVTLYLNGFQFVKDGDRIRGGDPSSLFKPMIGDGGEAKGRKPRGRG